MAMPEDIPGHISSEGRFLRGAGAAGESRVASVMESAALAVGVVAVFALLATVGFGKGCMRSGALTWKVARLRVVPGFISWHLRMGIPLIPTSILSAFHRVLGFFSISSSKKSSNASLVVGPEPATSGHAACDNIRSR